MTWVVAKSFLSGYVTVLSDVQVTWGNGTLRKDCLKKVYIVAPNMIAGFSGSVDLGFYMIDDLIKYIISTTKNNELVSPRKIAFEWYRRARYIFNDSDLKYTKLGCSIILAGTSPNEKVWGSFYDRSDIAILDFKNDFFPYINPQMKTASIGSGCGFEVYKSFMKEMDSFENMASFLGAENGLGRSGETLALLTSIMLKDNRLDGVSQNIHCTIVTSSGFRQFPLNFEVQKGSGFVKHAMPEVCESYSEYLEFSRDFVAGNGVGFA